MKHVLYYKRKHVKKAVYLIPSNPFATLQIVQPIHHFSNLNSLYPHPTPPFKP